MCDMWVIEGGVQLAVGFFGGALLEGGLVRAYSLALKSSQKALRTGASVSAV